MPYEVLTPRQAEHFLERGFVVVEDCFPRSAAQEWVDWAFGRIGYDPKDRSTWKEARIHTVPTEHHVDVRLFSPKAYGAIGDVIGGTERATLPLIWGDNFVVNLREGADRAYEAPSAAVKGWHKDGYFFRHFLDSGEQGLLVIPAWTDILSRGGGTFIAPDSVGVVARFLAEHPEGVEPKAFGMLIGQCHEFMEVTAKAGDVVLLHPFMLHAVSQNMLQVPRIISNPPVILTGPLNFNREDDRAYSLVERAVLGGLGVERLDFRAAGARRCQWPQWVLDAQEYHRQRSTACV